MSREKIEKIPSLIREIYEITNKLTDLFPGRSFTPDGHLVGSIGEVLAAYHYGLKLFIASAERHNAMSTDGRLVQIKATQGRSVSLRSKPDFLIVLQIKPSGESVEIYNGPGELAWQSVGKLQKNGQQQISLSTLKKLMEKVRIEEQIPKVLETAKNGKRDSIKVNSCI